ncbi:MAG TPA: hypothetical protein VFM70_04350 [Salinimicrobium sp.]|nr:hypothetical protein [Salinimicrobium sp.]
MSIVRDNLMKEAGYSPYCGAELCKPRYTYPLKGERWPRTKFDGEQFTCPKCGWQSEFDKEFIEGYKNKWNK